jgi:hypothetical protein
LAQWIVFARVVTIVVLILPLILLAWLIHLVSATRSTIPRPGGARRRPHYADEEGY